MWRVGIAVVLFLISLLSVLKAPTNFFWKTAIVVTEFPYIPIFISIAFLMSCFYAEKYKGATIVISVFAICFYMLPIVEVFIRGNQLTAEFKNNFPFKDSENQLHQPFSLTKMFSGFGTKTIAPQIITYKKLPGKNLSLDFYPAVSKTKAPCLIVIHGGSWASGDSKEIPALNSYLAARGYHVAAINYRLAPEYRSPAPVEDTKDAMDYLVRNADKLNIDPTNFILLGRSAGAQIALVAAYTFHDPRIKGVISFYGPADMVWGARLKSNKLVLNTDKVFTNYLGGLIDELPQKYHQASAFDFADKNSPPTLLIHGFNDVLVAYGHSQRLDKKLHENHVAHYFLNLPWATHGSDYNSCGPSGQITTFAIERFINSVTTQHEWKNLPS